MFTSPVEKQSGGYVFLHHVPKFQHLTESGRNLSDKSSCSDAPIMNQMSAQKSAYYKEHRTFQDHFS